MEEVEQLKTTEKVNEVAYENGDEDANVIEISEDEWAKRDEMRRHLEERR